MIQRQLAPQDNQSIYKKQLWGEGLVTSHPGNKCSDREDFGALLVCCIKYFIYFDDLELVVLHRLTKMY